ncbi:hypothetical protein [Caulobacter segnis]|uniref:Peptidase n=1 Tax=Caulobacter segnis TaxID=88688 RepID=A0A2W5VA86_9CAUL|nr:hypothetical protein [Caulobacter segnis]PZR32285.1 MAG: peptidase [Caulobacter segnis]
MQIRDANSAERNVIFRPGRHRAQSGQYFTFSEADVAAIAAAYDPAVHQAPYVLGHPKTDAAPAWGWVEKLEIQDGQLVAVASDVVPAFAEGVAAGNYRFRSADLYGPNDPANPKPGQYYLRSVGWLGAEPPAIKGLGAAFSERAEAEPLSFAETEMSLAWLASNVAGGFRSLRDWILAKFGQEAADAALPAWTDQSATQIAAEVRAEAWPGQVASFAEGEVGRVADLEARAADLDAREAAIAAREKAARDDQIAFAEGERQAARADDAAFVDGLVKAGRLPPARADQVKTLLGVLAGDQKISFAEGEADPRGQLRELLGKLGTAIHFGEVAPSSEARFSERQTGQDHADAIRAVMDEQAAAGRNISAAEAASIARNR